MQETIETEITRDEIKKEFQLERMILFSDAVFAIVITLMAIEIKLPETDQKLDDQLLLQQLWHIVPVLLAYCVSFTFIGVVWYNHLKMFSLLKDWNKGLVIRNLVLLFFVGLFPFTASLVTKAHGAMSAFFIYLGIIICCIIAQYLLYRHIVFGPQQIRLQVDLEEHYAELHKRKIAMIGVLCALSLIIVTYVLISDPVLKPMSVMWMLVFPLAYKLFHKPKTIKKPPQKH